LVLALLLILFVIRPILKSRPIERRYEMAQVQTVSSPVVFSGLDQNQETKPPPMSLKEQTLKIIHEDPQKAVGVLKTWLNERE